MPLFRRDLGPKERKSVSIDALTKTVVEDLQAIQDHYFEQARAYRDAHIRHDIKTLDEMKAFFTPKNQEKPEPHGGFVVAKWCEDPETEEMLKELKISIRCLPFEQSNTEGECIITGRPATVDAIFAKSY